ncbi:uncharacterized protein LOC123319393 isoform X2 [Coccinella septempunctata]|uniref:uncharacterized protein LOC123319393 isoform X2 n=1 Tax=Coccinella septempunctata TaxID=41139 RepID=UPI001D063F39|nr:uncharacterized protein LOC123319393 isoform X2 [Coccinella septempunctata]
MFQIPKELPGLATSNYIRYTLYVIMVIGQFTPCIAECNTIQWWTDPCNNTPAPPMMEKYRHGRSAERNVVVINQLKMLIIKSRKDLKDMERLYRNETGGVKHLRHTFEWLNTTEMVRRIKSPKNFKIKLRRLHPYLQRFAGALEILSSTSINSQGHFNKNKRNGIIYEAKKNLRGLICEVNQAIPSRFRRKLCLEKMHIGLPTQMNLTDSYFYDVQILKNLKRFLTQIEKKGLKLRLKKKHRKHV